MKIENALRYLTALQQKSAAYTHAMSLLYFDSVTVAPADTADGRDDTYSVLSEAAYKLMSCKRTENALRVAKENLSRLTFVQQRQVESLTRDREEISKIPMAEYVEYQLLINRAENIWIKAKKANDYAMFAPYLQQIFGTTIRFAGYTDPGKDPYDVMLNRYERGLNCETADRFFAKLRSDIVPLIRKVSASRQPDISFIRGNFPIDRQRELTDYIMDVMCIDRSHCNVGETEHPFTIEFNNKDVRITTNYHLDDFTNSMYSVIHEGGHALYELGIGDEYRRTCLAGDTAMSIHESQSRLFENCIGRSAEFIDAVMPKLRELFGLDGVTERQMYCAVNRSEPSLIRIDADELTYALHVMVRYEIEKQLMHGEITVDSLPQRWNAMMKEYLGVDVPDDAHGVLQDSHWSNGMIGYFPSYAIGSAYAAQIMESMRRDIDVSAAVSSGKLKPICHWLDEKIHHDGGLYTPGEIILQSCGAPFDPDCYVRYLTEKFTDLYSL